MDIFRFNGRPMLLFAVSTICGIYAATGENPLIALFVAGGVITAALFTKTWHPYIIAAALLVLIFFAYGEIIEKTMDVKYGEFDGVKCTLRGRIAAVGPKTNDYTILYIKTGGMFSGGKVKLYIFDGGTQYLRGETISAVGTLHKPEKATNPAGYDERKAMYADGAAAKLYAGEKECEKTGRYVPLYVFGFLSDHITRTCTGLLGKGEGGVLAGMLVGDRSGLDRRTEDNYRDSGLSHTMAVSGAHVACLLAPLFFIFKKAGWEKRKFYPLLLFLLLFFALLTGLKPSVSRACITAGVMLLAGMTDNDIEPVNSLSFSCLILVTMNPFAIYDAGFILSFTCVLSILFFHRSVQRFLGRGKVSALIAISVSVQAGIWPVCAKLFHTVQLMSVAANIIIFPVRAVLSVCGWVMYLTSLISPFAAFLISKPVSIMIRSVSSTAEIFSSTDFSVINIPRLPALMVFLYFVAVFGFLYFKRRGFVASAGILAILISYMLFFAVPANTCVFFDAGQADCHLVKTNRGRDILIDTGRYALSNPIAYFAGDYIDAIFLTHAHSDHAGGLEELLKRFRTGVVYLPGCPGAETQEIKRTCDRNNVKYETLTAGDTIMLDEYEINVLHPAQNNYLALNDTSLVLKLEYENHEMLFCGDIEAAAQAEILKRGEAVEARILKVPHHGSKTSASQEFMDRVSAKTAVISCGSNVFGHPSQRMLDVLEESRIYRTDLNGAVIIRIKNDAYSVETAVE